MGRSRETAMIIQIRQRQDMLRRDFAKTRAMMKRQKREMMGIGKQISTTIAASFGAFQVIAGVGKAIKSIAGLEMQMSKVKAISGASKKQFEDLKKNALDLGRTTKFTATEIGKLQEELSKLGFTPEKITASTDAIRKLATVADAELGESAKTMAGTLNSFNLSATESDRVANIMAESFSKSALDLEKFTVATSNSGAIANVFGHTLEQNTARLGALVDANIDASKAGTDLRRIYLNLNSSGLSYNQAMQKIIESTDQGGTAQKLFGDRAAGAAVILARQQEKVNELTGSLGDTNTELDRMVDIMEDNLLTDFKKLESAIDGAIQKGGGLTGLFRSIINGVTFSINALNGALPTPDEKFFKEWEQAGKRLANGLRENEGDLKAASNSVKFYQNSLKEATEKLEKLNNTSREDDGFTGFERTKEFRRLTEQVLKYSAILGPLQQKESAITEHLSAQANEVKKLTEAQIKLNKAKERAAFLGLDKTTFRFDHGVSGKINELETLRGAGDFGAGESFEKQMEQLILTGGEANAAIGEEFGKALDEASAQAEAYQQEMASIVEGLNATINQALVEATSAFIEGFVNGGIEQAFAGLLDVIGQGLINLGKTLIAFGVALEAFKNAPGPAKIVAGAAAIAAGSLVRKAAASLAASPSGTGAGGGASGPTGRFQSDRAGQSVTIKLEGELKGDARSLNALIKQEQIFDLRNIG